MNRWVWPIACAVTGAGLLAGSVIMPAHLQAVDTTVLQRAGRGTASLVDEGLRLVNGGNAGAALLLSQAAQAVALGNREGLARAISNQVTRNPVALTWEPGAPRLALLFAESAGQPSTNPEPFTLAVVRGHNRDRVLRALADSTKPAVQELLRCRNLGDTLLFPSAQSSAGQALDTAIGAAGLLLEGGHLTPGLNEALARLSAGANRGGDSTQIEQALLDVLSLGQRFTWGQLTAFLGAVEDTETLRRLAHEARRGEGQLPVLFGAVVVSGEPGSVADYLCAFSDTGLRDLGQSLRYGAGSLHELLRHQRRLCPPATRLAAFWLSHAGLGAAPLLDLCRLKPALALALKWLACLAGCYLLATALCLRRGAGFGSSRRLLFALGSLLVILLLSEPFLAQESRKVELPFRLRLPTVGSPVPAETASVRSSFMSSNQRSLLTLLLFFILQALLYCASLKKLAEIRRQNVSPRLKLKLLENEEHLFDAGLYLGFVGTILSLIAVSLGVIKLSLMAGYSSTSFGIIFVSLFKICHLRPMRRQVVLEAEATGPAPNSPQAASASASAAPP
jgi:hypothetical protein